jgi:hypothetical protein
MVIWLVVIVVMFILVNIAKQARAFSIDIIIV